mmetsp:Transcript_25485/g.42049  ORF Transcript_25485/g.42049 Transcript_25485/m.42049 type:complete len:370 (-) Transcript_25485:1031-2140(-)
MMSEEQRDDDSCASTAHQNEDSPDNMTKTSPTISDGSQPMASPADNEFPSPQKNDKDNFTDDTSATPGSQTEQNKTNLRRGKWTPEEEAYARAVICDFNSGYLDAPIGTTLRAYLSGKLGCDPMRITKKFTKASSIGKKVFRPASQHDAKVAKEVEDAQANVADLYQKWKQRIETQKEETNRKSSVEASLTGEIILNSKTKDITHIVTPDTMTLVQKTADWLEKADGILSKISKGERSADETAAEMKEVKSLIDQGPTVLAAVGEVSKMLKNTNSKGLPSRLHSCPDFRKIAGTSSATSSKKRKHPLIDDELVKKYDSNPINLLASLSSRAAPVPVSNGNSKQRKRKGSEVNSEDAKAFVSFLQSVAHE